MRPILFALSVAALVACAPPLLAAPEDMRIPPPPPPPAWGADGIVVSPRSPALTAVAAPVAAPPPCAPCAAVPPCPPKDPCATGCPTKPFDLGPCWTVRLGAFFSLKTGNSENIDFKGDVEIERKPSPWGGRFYLAYIYGESDVETYADEWHGVLRVERKLGARAYAFAEVLYDRDVPADLEYRFTGTLGGGYTIVDNGRDLLKAEAGLGGVLEKYELLDETFDPTAYLGARYERKWGEGNRVFADLKFLPNLSDFDLSRVILDAGYEMPLCAWLKLALGLRIDYQVDPPDPEVEDTDLLFTVGLKAVF